MKKIISILFSIIIAFSVAGCAADTKNDKTTTVSYKNLDKDAKEKIDNCVQLINMVLDLNWSSERPQDLWMESGEFQSVLDTLYRHEYGYAPSDSGDIVKMSDYADVAYKYFGIDENILRSILSVGTYDFSTDTLIHHFESTTPAEVKISKVDIKDNVYTVYYTREYDGYEDRDYFVAFNTGVLTLRMDENGFTFISNKVKKSEYDSVGSDRLKPFFQRRITALGDMLNYSWDENGKGTLFTQPYGKSVQAYIDRAGAMLYGYETKQNWTRYVRSAQKFLLMDDDQVLQMLGYDGENYAKYTREEIKPDSGNFRIVDSISYKDGLYYIDYINGIRTLDAVTGRYQLQNAVKSQLVVKNVDGSPKILANRNAYYDVHENKRFQHYLDLLAPVLKYSWDENTVNTLTMDTNTLKVAAQTLNYNYNIPVLSGTADTRYYKQIIDRYFEFGQAGCEYALSSDYKSEDGTVSAGVNTEDAETARLTDVVYSGDDVMIYYQQGNDSGLLTVRKYDNGIEKFVSNRYNHRQLTADELTLINNYYQNSDVWKYTLMFKSFDSPQQLDLEKLLYKIAPDGKLDKGCYYEIKKAKEKDLRLDFEGVENGSKIYKKISYDSLQSMLKRAYNISVRDIANLNDLVYSDLYRCFYVVEKVTGYANHKFTDGYIENDTVVFSSDRGQVTMKKAGDNFYIQSYMYQKKK